MLRVPPSVLALFFVAACGDEAPCDPETATVPVTAWVTDPSGTALDDATVERDGEPCEALGDGGGYDCGGAGEGTMEILALHPMWGSVLERLEVAPCEERALEVDIALESPMGL